MDPLHILLEREECIRALARTHKSLTVWPSEATIGIASRKACCKNSKLLELVALWWTSASEHPSAIPIDRLREEVGISSKKVNDVLLIIGGFVHFKAITNHGKMCYSLFSLTHKISNRIQGSTLSKTISFPVRFPSGKL